MRPLQSMLIAGGLFVLSATTGIVMILVFVIATVMLQWTDALYKRVRRATVKP